MLKGGHKRKPFHNENFYNLPDTMLHPCACSVWDGDLHVGTPLNYCQPIQLELYISCEITARTAYYIDTASPARQMLMIIFENNHIFLKYQVIRIPTVVDMRVRQSARTLQSVYEQPNRAPAPYCL